MDIFLECEYGEPCSNSGGVSRVHLRVNALRKGTNPSILIPAVGDYKKLVCPAWIAGQTGFL